MMLEMMVNELSIVQMSDNAENKNVCNGAWKCQFAKQYKV